MFTRSKTSQVTFKFNDEFNFEISNKNICTEINENCSEINDNCSGINENCLNNSNIEDIKNNLELDKNNNDPENYFYLELLFSETLYLCKNNIFYTKQNIDLNKTYITIFYHDIVHRYITCHPNKLPLTITINPVSIIEMKSFLTKYYYFNFMNCDSLSHDQIKSVYNIYMCQIPIYNLYCLC